MSEANATTAVSFYMRCALCSVILCSSEADPLMPDSENMRTYIAASGTDAASKALSKELNRIHQSVEDNLSTIGEQLFKYFCCCEIWCYVSFMVHSPTRQ